MYYQKLHPKSSQIHTKNSEITPQDLFFIIKMIILLKNEEMKD